MKRTLLCMAMILMAGLYSCQQNDEFLPPAEEPSAQEEGGTRISPEKAVEMADSYLELLSPATRSARKSPTVEVYGKDVALTRASGTEIPDTLLYIVNYGGEGFALIAADYRMDDLYAISDEGSFNLSDTTLYPEMKFMMGMIEQYAASSMEAATRATVTSRDGRIWNVVERIEKKVNAKWGQQGDPFNTWCKTTNGLLAKAGCAPIAISQIMYYHSAPNSHTNSRTGQTYTYNWNQMKSVVNASTGDTSAKNQVARLIEQVGSECYATYGAVGTNNGTSVNDWIYAVSCFEKMGYSVGQMANYNITSIKGSLSNYGPVYVSGTTTVVDGENKTVGHAWVIDGYLKMTDITPGPTLLGTKELVRCNWGWDGTRDGYYISNAFNLIDGAYIEGDGSWRDVNFRYDLRIIPYIHLNYINSGLPNGKPFELKITNSTPYRHDYEVIIYDDSPYYGHDVIDETFSLNPGGVRIIRTHLPTGNYRLEAYADGGYSYQEYNWSFNCSGGYIHTQYLPGRSTAYYTLPDFENLTFVCANLSF